MEPSPVSATPLDPQEVLETILKHLGLPGSVEKETVEGNVLLHVSTPEPGRVIGRRGQTLSQMQFLINRMVMRSSQDAPRVTIDCENYRGKQRDDTLRQAREAADKVRRWGEPVDIGPLNAFDRRVIHQSFADDKELEAVSEDEQGSGLKRMTIRLRQ